MTVITVAVIIMMTPDLACLRNTVKMTMTSIIMMMMTAMVIMMIIIPLMIILMVT